jgi:hypothetical protein
LNVVYTYTFNRDHSFTSTASDSSAVLDGKWVKTKTNQYVVTYSFSDKVSTFVYDPQADTLYEPDYPTLTIYRTGRPPAVVTTTPSKVVLFSDDFSQWRSEWDQMYSGEGGKVSYSGGTVHIRVPSSGDTMYHQLHQNFGDFSLDVDTKVVDGTTDNWFGADVREQDNDNYYRFSISGDGYYRISRFRNGDFTSLSGPTRSGYINTGVGAGNHLRIECNKNILSLTVNGQPLSTVSDDSFGEGTLSLSANSVATGKYTEVTFDNLKITTP